MSSGCGCKKVYTVFPLLNARASIFWRPIYPAFVGGRCNSHE